jgi:hypothetical protein
VRVKSIVHNRDERTYFSSREDILVGNYKLIGADKVIRAKIFVGIQKEYFLEKNKQGSADP